MPQQVEDVGDVRTAEQTANVRLQVDPAKEQGIRERTPEAHVTTLTPEQHG